MRRGVREITAELFSTGLNADQMALVTELVASTADASGGRSKHAEAQAKYRKSRVITNDHTDHQIPPQHISTPPIQKPKKVSVCIDASEIPEKPSDEAISFAR